MECKCKNPKAMNVRLCGICDGSLPYEECKNCVNLKAEIEMLKEEKNQKDMRIDNLRKQLKELEEGEKIIQILKLENDSTWQGRLLGLSNLGNTFEVGRGGNWERFIPNI